MVSETENTSATAADVKTSGVRAPNEKEAMMFYSILVSMPDEAKKLINWSDVFALCGLKNEKCAKDRFAQIMKAIGNSTGSASTPNTTPKKTPKKATPKSKTDGILSPTAKVTKPRGRPAKAKAAPAVKEEEADTKEDDNNEDEVVEDA